MHLHSAAILLVITLLFCVPSYSVNVADINGTFTVTAGSKTAASPYFGTPNASTFSYFINGVEGGTITLEINKTYTFNLTTVPQFHPLGIYSAPMGGPSSTPLIQFGYGQVIQYPVPDLTGATLFYGCAVHNFMGGQINFAAPPTSTSGSTNTSTSGTSTGSSTGASNGTSTGTSAAGTSAAGTSAAGTSAAGTSAAGTSAAGTSAAGTSAAGTSAAGTSAAGTSAAGTSGSSTGTSSGIPTSTSAGSTSSSSSTGSSSTGSATSGTSAAGTSSATTGTSAAGSSSTSAGTSDGSSTSSSSSSTGPAPSSTTASANTAILSIVCMMIFVVIPTLF